MGWRWLGVLGLLGALVGVVPAAVLSGKTDSTGILATAQVATGVSANSVDFPQMWKGRWLYFLYRNTAGTVTVHVEVNCVPRSSAAFATSWVIVPNSTKALGVGADGAQVDQPGCSYQTNVNPGDCAGCSLNVNYYAGSELQ